MLRVATNSAERTLQVYLLGRVDFDDMLRCQRRLVYEVSGDRSRSILLLCEHSPLITIGRQGSWDHIRYEPCDLAAREWPVRWVNRGGGCLLHLPGQVAMYPILALDRMGLNLRWYLENLHCVLTDLFSGTELNAGPRPGRAGVWVKDRLLAQVGVAVRDWVSYFGAVVNVHPDLEPFRRVEVAGPGEPPMTSLAREQRDPMRDAAIRQRIIESFTQRFGFSQTVLFHQHPALNRSERNNAVPSGSH